MAEPTARIQIGDCVRGEDHNGEPYRGVVWTIVPWRDGPGLAAGVALVADKPLDVWCHPEDLEPIDDCFAQVNWGKATPQRVQCENFRKGRGLPV